MASESPAAHEAVQRREQGTAIWDAHVAGVGQRSAGWRLTMRELFALVAAAALCASAARNCGRLAAVGIGCAAVCGWLAYRESRHRWLRDARILLLPSAVLLFWFAAVDRQISLVRCPHCDSHYFAFQYRIVGIPLATTRQNEHGDLLAKIARDLGKPCVHDYQQRPLVRRWGLLLTERQADGMTCCLGIGPDYAAQVRPKVLALARSHPEVAQEFHRRVLLEKDYQYLRKLCARLRRQAVREPITSTESRKLPEFAEVKKRRVGEGTRTPDP
jgi:hypothetical protein